MRTLLALCLAWCWAGPSAGADKPNVVVIMVDDMGWSDLSCYGGEIPTPNLDALAAGGLRFTQFYNTGRCCPTRASLLTGLYSHQAGVGHMTADKGPDHPAYRGHLNDSCVTIGDVLRPAGYFTAVSGKWHVGHSDPSMLPTRRGFDRFYGVPEGGGFYFKLKAGRTVRLNDEVIHTARQQPPEGWYSTDAWNEWGVRFIDEARDAGKPFFLYLAHNAPHFPLQADPEDIARHRGKFGEGWDRLREQRHRRQIDAGLIEPSWALSPRPPQVKAWDELTPEQQDRFDHIMAIYAATIDRMDRSVGVLVGALKERGLLDDTLILFLSDNGGSAEGGPNGKFDGDPPGSADSDVYCGQSWATLQNTPFRRYKSFNHEGGIATPLIAHWPKGIAARGELRHQVGHVIDLLPTCAEVCGATYPTEHEGRPVLPAAGLSLVPAFADRPIERGPLFWEHEGNRAVRLGDWKLSAVRGGPWELYDLSSDRTELTDLASVRKDKLAELTDAWDRWAERAHVEIARRPSPPGNSGGKP